MRLRKIRNEKVHSHKRKSLSLFQSDSIQLQLEVSSLTSLRYLVQAVPSKKNEREGKIDGNKWKRRGKEKGRRRKGKRWKRGEEEKRMERVCAEGKGKWRMRCGKKEEREKEKMKKKEKEKKGEEEKEKKKRKWRERHERRTALSGRIP